MSNSSASLPNESPGQWLTRQMERKDLGVRQLARALDVTEKAIYEWRGDRTAISEVRVSKLAEVLGVSELEARRGLGYWVPETGEPERPDMRSELLELRQQLVNILERIDEIQRRQ